MRRLGVAVAVLALVGCGGGNEGTWQASTVPGPGSLGAVWAFAPDDVWVSGLYLWHYDGTAFRQEQAPVFAADFLGFAPNDLYAVGGEHLYHWNGTAWSTVDFGGAVAASELQSIWGTSKDDLWLGDFLDGRVLHWDGARWTQTTTQTGHVTDLWGSSDHDVLAAGVFGFQRWNGTAWSDITAPAAANPVGLWGFGADDVWAVGDFSTLAHWDGTQWKDELPADDPKFTQEDHASVWGAAPDDVWAVGDFGAISHWDGARWTQTQFGTFPYFPFLAAVHGSSARDIWAVGRSIDPSAGATAALVLHLQR
jgi:hypothetical protein